MTNAFNQGPNSGRFYELLEALKSEYEMHRHSVSLESLPKLSREEYEVKGNFLGEEYLLSQC